MNPTQIRATRDAQNPGRRGLAKAVAIAKRPGVSPGVSWRDPNPQMTRGCNLSAAAVPLYRSRQAAALLRLSSAASVDGYDDWYEWRHPR